MGLKESVRCRERGRREKRARSNTTDRDQKPFQFTSLLFTPGPPHPHSQRVSFSPLKQIDFTFTGCLSTRWVFSVGELKTVNALSDNQTEGNIGIFHISKSNGLSVCASRAGFVIIF